MPLDMTMYGDESRNHPRLQDAWRRAALFERDHPCAEGVRWVPWETVRVDPKITPRETTTEVVKRYADSFLELPEITVQRRTFTMVDGRHRIEAAAEARCDFIRVREVDLPDEALAAEAYLANLRHGHAYTLSERVRGLEVILRREPYASWSGNQLSALTGLDADTVRKHRKRIQPDIYVQNEPTENRLVGADGKSRPASTRSNQPSAAMTSATPHLAVPHGLLEEPDEGDLSALAEQWEDFDGDLLVSAVRALATVGVSGAAAWMALSDAQQVAVGDNLDAALGLLEELGHERG
jgi:hypothetical protein